MNIQTYVYGTPHGFDMFEEAPSLKEFFKSFYISSRKGSRLVITRKDTGETLYNYLHYGLMEKDGRPNSFFGMTLLVDGGAYMPDFTGMYDWFEFLFMTFLNRQNTLFSERKKVLFHTKDDGIIQYCVDKFLNAYDEVEWIKSQIPNILSSSADTRVDNYNNSFVWIRNGQIALHNSEDDNAEILSDFRKYSTVAVSKSFTKAISLDYQEMISFLNDFNQQLLPIAVNKDDNSFKDLESINEKFSALYTSLSSYVLSQKGKDDVEYQNFYELRNKYNLLQQQISKLLSSYSDKIGHKKRDFNDNVRDVSTKVQPVNIKYCVGCKQNKYLSEFESSDDNICKDCKRRNQNRLRKCQKCGRHLSPINFDGKSLVCKECGKQQVVEQNIFWKENAYWIKIALLCAVATFVIVFMFFAFRSCSKSEDIVDSESLHDITSEHSPELLSTVDENKLNNFIDSKDFNGAIKYIMQCQDGDKFLEKINKVVQLTLWQLISTSSYSGDEFLQEWFIKNPDVVTALNLDKQEWLTKYTKYSEVYQLISKSNFTANDYSDGLKLISEFPNEIKTPILAKLDEKKSSIPTPIQPVAETQSSPNVTVITPNGPQAINRTRGFEGKPGEVFTVTSDQKIKIRNNNNDAFIIKSSSNSSSSYKVIIAMNNIGSVILDTGNIQITLNCVRDRDTDILEKL